MPITAGFTALQSLIKVALISDVGGSPDTLAQIITNAIATISSMGMYPSGISMVPLVPAGMSGTQAIMKNALISDISGNPNVLAQIISSSISMLCSIVPPVGITSLQALLSSLFASVDIGGSPDVLAQQIASAIITYFTVGGTI
jgi:hypothetical protein